MFKSALIVALLLAGLISFSTRASAQVETRVCFKCTKNAFPVLAESVARRNGIHAVIVFDPIEEISQKFKVVRRYVSGEIDITATPIDMTTAEQDALRKIYLYRKEVIHQLTQAAAKDIPYGTITGPTNTYKNTDDVFTVDFGFYGNPFEFILTSQDRNNFYDYYVAQAQTVIDQIAAAIAGSLKIPNLQDMKVLVRITSYDHATGEEVGDVVIQIDFNTKEVVVVSARDAENNSIPLTSNGLVGENFRYADTSNFTLMDSYLNSKFTNFPPGVQCTLVQTNTIVERISYTYKCS